MNLNPEQFTEAEPAARPGTGGRAVTRFRKHPWCCSPLRCHLTATLFWIVRDRHQAARIAALQLASGRPPRFPGDGPYSDDPPF
jgi:hypothetical protein